MNSILQTQKKCILCGRTGGLDRHHVLNGQPNRKLSERYGLTVWLCREHHDLIHREQKEDIKLKQFAQTVAMRHYGWSKEDFIRIFGKNYLEE